jgi:hypothetical protein
VDVHGFARFITDAVRRQRGGVKPAWDKLEIRELSPLLSAMPISDGRRRRLDLLFTVGPLSNEYPTAAARALIDDIPSRLELAFDDDVLDGRGRAHLVGPARTAEAVDDDGHVTLTLTVGTTLELR